MDFKVTDLVKNVVLAGIGAAAVTTEKAKDVADELVKKGSLTTLKKPWIIRKKRMLLLRNCCQR